MSRVFAVLALSLGLLATPASAVVLWDIDPALSNFRLTIPDQVVTLGTVTATMRLRNQNNATWTQNNAPVDGLLATQITPGVTSIQFLGGSSSLTGVTTGNYRPNPAAFNTAVTDTLNTGGTFTNTTSDPAVYAARVNAQISFITVNTGYIAFDNMSYDLASLITPIVGTAFAANAVNLGILDSRVGYDGINTIAGQVVPDTLAQTGPISGANVLATPGSIVNLGAQYRLTVPINMPVFVNLGGVMLNATATGTLVGFAPMNTVPEPATLGLVAIGLIGLAVHGRRRAR